MSKILRTYYNSANFAMDDEREKSRLKEATDKLGCLILPLDLGSGEMNVS